VTHECCSHDHDKREREGSVLRGIHSGAAPPSVLKRSVRLLGWWWICRKLWPKRISGKGVKVAALLLWL
jgi:hypothetical protein